MEESRTIIYCRTCGGALDTALPGAGCPRCLAAALEGELLPPAAGGGAGIGVAGYQLGGVLGRGGMGIVYRARQQHPKREVALKMLLPAILDHEDMRTRFFTEVQAMASLNHENILPLYQFGEHEGRPFFTTLLADGGSLAHRIKEHKFAPAPRVAAEMLAQLADAVQYAHDHGVLHRDLKPSNILFDAADRPLVADFGLARIASSDGSITEAVIMGTPNYLAPEVVAADARAATTATDVYGLGAVFYELLSGRPPFESKSVPDLLRSISEKDPAPAVPAEGSPRPTPPRDLQIICHKCLAKEPAKRYSSARALADDLRRWLRGESILARRASRTERVVSWARRNPAMAAMYVILTAVLVAAITAQTLALKKSRRLESEARAARLDAEEQIGFALGDYADRVEAMGRYELLNESFANIRRYYERLPESQMDEAARLTKARFLVRAAAVRDAQGDLSAAEFSLREALNLLPHGDPETGTTAYRQLAAVLLKDERESEALAALDAAIALAAAAPENAFAAAGHAAALLDRAELRRESLWRKENDYSTVHADLREARAILERQLPAAPPESPLRRRLIFLRIMAMQHSSATLIDENKAGDKAGTALLDQAMQGIEDFSRGIAVLPGATGRDTLRDRALAEAAEWRGRLLLEYGGERIDAANAELKRAAGMFEHLVAADPLDIRARNSLAMTHWWRADVFRATDDKEGEWEAREQARHHYEAALRQAPLNYWLVFKCGTFVEETVRSVTRGILPKSAPDLAPYLELHLMLAQSAGHLENVWRLEQALVRDTATLLRAKDPRAALALLESWTQRLEALTNQPLSALAAAGLWRERADLLKNENPVEALAASRRALELRASLLRRSLASGDISGSTAGAYEKLHALLAARHLTDELEDSVRAALSDAPLVRQLTPVPKSWRGNWAGMFTAGAAALTRAGRPHQAAVIARDALSLLYEEHPPVPFTGSEIKARNELAAAALPGEKPQ